MNNNTLLKKNFVKFLKQRRSSVYKLANEIGENRTNIYNFLNKGNTSYPLLVKIVKRHPDIISILFPIEEKEDPTQIIKVAEPKATYTTPKNTTDHLDLIPYYDIDIKSELIDFSEARTDKYISIPENPDLIAFLPIRGSTMSPIINNGDIIGIKEAPENHIIDTSLVYLVITEQNRMIKYLSADPQNNLIWCTSANPNHKPFSIEMKLLKGLYIVAAKITHL